ncbi:MAG: DUF2225 domain-containing protein [bacterium]|nr:DUF2225 domain-containing protein [bacterium]
MARNIFVEQEVLCPSCKTSITLKFPNPKFYAASSRDADQRITGYSWAAGIKTDVLPHHYAVFQCPNCMMADFRGGFEAPKQGLKENALYTALQTVPFDIKMVLRKLRRLIPADNLNDDAAIALHLAAIFCALLAGKKESIDHMKLGRFYIRLSWLYREQMGDFLSADSKDKDSNLGKLSGAVDEIMHSIRNFSQNLTKAKSFAGERAKELTLPPDDNPYFNLTNSIAEKMNRLQQEVTKLRQAMMLDQKGVNLSYHSRKSTGEPEGLDQLLTSLLPRWPDLPQTEAAAIKLAVEALDYSYKFEDSGHTIAASLSVVNLIITLLLKTGDLEQAMSYIMQIFIGGARDKQELQMRLNQGKREKKLNDSEIKSINKQLSSISSSLSMAGETRRKILGFLFERDKTDITAILEKKADASFEEQKQALISAGYAEELIPWLRDKQLMKNEDQKKKWFGK